MAINKEVKLLINYDGEIRYHQPDNKLTYVDGHTKILYVDRNITIWDMINKLQATCNGRLVGGFKYPFPGKDDNLLISVHFRQDDLENMMREYDKLCNDSNTTPIMQLFIP